MGVNDRLNESTRVMSRVHLASGTGEVQERYAGVYDGLRVPGPFIICCEPSA